MLSFDGALYPVFAFSPSCSLLPHVFCAELLGVLSLSIPIPYMNNTREIISQYLCVNVDN